MKMAEEKEFYIDPSWKRVL